MEFKAEALMLRSADYGENDKMVTLLTAERGKIGAAMKGVKKAGAKLRFAAQPFCFAEYVFAERSGRFTVTSASLFDGFYPLREDVNKFYAGAAVCEVCDKLAFEEMPCGDLLVSAVSALGQISSAASGTSLPLIRFLLSALSSAGYPVAAEECPHCGRQLFGRMYFDVASGSFFCNGCAKGVPASETTYHTVRMAQGLSYDPVFLGADGEKRAVRLLLSCLSYETEASFPSLEEYLRLL